MILYDEYVAERVTQTAQAVTKDMLNSMAYDDVLNFDSPSMPYDEEYMKRYTFWRSIGKFPGDDEVYDYD